MTNVDVGPGAIVCSEAAITGDVTIGDILQFYDDIDDQQLNQDSLDFHSILLISFVKHLQSTSKSNVAKSWN